MTSTREGARLAARSTTFWHVTEIADPQGGSPPRSYTVPNTNPRMLRTLAAPYLATHRAIATQRRRARNGASSVRFELEPIDATGSQLILHALLISLTAAR